MHHFSRRARAAVVTTVVASAALVPALAFVPSASADDKAKDTEGLSWSVVPVPPKGKTAAPRSYFILEGEPGDVIKDKVLIQNWTPYPITFELFGADAYNTDDTGSFALRSMDDDKVDLGKWIKPAIKRVTVYGETAATVPVKFKIPKNATPGDHVGGVVALNSAVETKTEGSVSVGLQRAIGARAYVRVAGNTSPGIEIKDVKVEHDRGAWPWSGDDDGQVTYTLVNTGNLRLSPTGTATVDGLGADTDIDLGKLTDLLPGSEVTLSHAITGIPGVGGVEVEVEFDAGEGLVARDSVSFTLIPWPFVVALLALLGGGTFVWMRRRDVTRRRLKAAGDAPKISVMAEEEARR